jgi:hypothetical protein
LHDFEIPNPSAITIGPPLLEILWFVAHDLIEKLAHLVGIGILGHNLWRRAITTIREKIAYS